MESQGRQGHLGQGSTSGKVEDRGARGACSTQTPRGAGTRVSLAGRPPESKPSSCCPRPGRKVAAHCLSSTSFRGLKETVSPVPLPGKEKGFTPMLSTQTAGTQDVTLIPLAISCNFQNLPPVSFQLLLLVLSPPVSPLLCTPPSLLPLLLLLSLSLSLLSPTSLCLPVSALSFCLSPYLYSLPLSLSPVSALSSFSVSLSLLSLLLSPFLLLLEHTTSGCDSVKNLDKQGQAVLSHLSAGN